MAPRKRTMEPDQVVGMTAAQLNQLMHGLAQQFQNVQAAQQAAPAHGQAQAPELHSFPKKNKEFTSLGVSKFYGDGPAERAYEWIDEIEGHFEKMPELTAAEKTLLGAQQLKQVAHTWWSSTRAHMNVVGMEWDRFKELFFEEFVPEARKAELTQRFLNFQQGNMSVEGYARAFKELARYAPGFVATEAQKVERFISGLRHDLKFQMITCYGQDMKTVYNTALRGEITLKEKRDQKIVYPGESSRSAAPRRDNNQYNNNNNNNRRGGQNQRQGRNRGGYRHPYQRDQRVQPVQPVRAQGQVPQLPAPPAQLALPAPAAAIQGDRDRDRQCYYCRETGHLARDCPSQRAGLPPALARGKGGRGGHDRGRGRHYQPQRQPGHAYAALAAQPFLEEPQIPGPGAGAGDAPQDVPPPF